MIGPNTSLASSRELLDSDPRVTPVPDGLIVEWTAASPLISEGDDGRSIVEIPGFDTTDQPGAPRVPFSSALVAIPRGADPTVEVLSIVESTQSIDTPLELGKQPEGVVRSSSGQIIGGAFGNPSSQINGPTEAVQLERIGVLRGVDLARLTFYPVRFLGKDLLVTTHLEVKINFGIRQLQAGSTGSNPLRSTLQSAVINPGQLPAAAADSLADLFEDTKQLSSNPTAAIEVSETGITEITLSDLAAIGFPVNSIDPSKLHLTRAGAPVEYQWLSATDSLLFFADPRFSRWTSADTYFLSVEGTNGARMASRTADNGSAGVPKVERLFEENNIYTPQCYCAPIPAGRDGDRWVWDRLQRPAPATGTYDFQLTGVDKSQDANLKIWLIGFTQLPIDNDHKVQVSVNGSNRGTVIWDGKSTKEKDFTIPGSLLIEGTNQLELTLLDTGEEVDGIWLDAFSVKHALSDAISVGERIGFSGPNHNHNYSVTMASPSGVKVFDVSQPDEPVILNGFQVSGSQITFSNPNTNQPHDYWVTTTAGISSPDVMRMVSQTLISPGYQGADYLIITPQEFIPALSDLIAMHQSNGLEVALEDVQAIYDAYGEGRPLPSAIKSFLEDVYFSWTTPPTYVLLVGDGTYDPKGYLASSTKTYIPPFLAEVDPWAGETAADNRYVTVDGNDILPDMIIGRLPANNLAELAAMVSKIVQYENEPFDIWNHQAAFVADDPDPKSGDFPSLSDILIAQFPHSTFTPHRLYFDPAQDTAEGFSTEIKQVWQDGNALMVFTGHSSIYYWTHDIVLDVSDIQDLNNGQKLPVLLEMTCFTGSFQMPKHPTLDEQLLRDPDGGVVAVWGSTGLGVSTGHHWLAEGFMSTIFTDGTSEIGKAVLAGKLNLASLGFNPDLIDTFTLLGDPATKLERSFQNYIPINKN